MADNQLIKLIEKLHERTLQRKLRWEETPIKNKFMCAFSNYVVNIFSYESIDFAGSEDYALSINNEYGDTVDRIDDTELSRAYKEMGVVGPDGIAINGYIFLREIHETARRISFGTDAAIHELLGELDKY